MDRYDRQRRLWSGSGQQRLNSSHVQVFGASTAATEVVKSLVLAGVGHVTWSAPLPITEDMVATNFFLSENDLFKSFDLAITESLSTLNPDVILQVGEVNSPDLVITTSSPTKNVIGLVYQFESPVLQIDAVGFYARFHLWLRDPLAIVETHGNTQWDIRFLNLWPEYADYVSRCPLDAETPWCVILAKCRNAYKGELNRSEFSKYVHKQALSTSSENIEEAAASAWRALKGDEIPDGLVKLMDWAANTKDDSEFVRAIRGISRFINLHGMLPLNGNLPDMRASTQRYLEVLDIYRRKASKDAEEVAVLGGIDSGVARKYCQNARTLRLILPEDPESQISTEGLSKILDEVIANPSRGKYFSFPGMPFIGTGAEIYSVASLIGGIGAQEATKVLMAQYTPLCGELIYDGIKQCTSVCRYATIMN